MLNTVGTAVFIFTTKCRPSPMFVSGVGDQRLIILKRKEKVE